MKSVLYYEAVTASAHQTPDDFDRRLVSSVAAGTNKHCQEDGHHQVIFQELLILF